MAGPVHSRCAYQFLNHLSLALNSSIRMRVSLSLTLCALLAACNRTPEKTLTIAVNAGVEGTALKLAAKEWGAASGVHVEVVELPYSNLFEKEELDLTSRTGAYDVVMMDDPWFPLMSDNGNLAELPRAPDADFLPSCVDV